MSSVIALDWQNRKITDVFESKTICFVGFAVVVEELHGWVAFKD